jgi:hypothetical protein
MGAMGTRRPATEADVIMVLRQRAHYAIKRMREAEEEPIAEAVVADLTEIDRRSGRDISGVYPHIWRRLAEIVSAEMSSDVLLLRL